MPNAKRKEKLTKTLVDGLSPAGFEYAVWDTQVEGFHVRVSPAGLKTLCVYYRSKRNQGRRRSLGRYPTVGVEEARQTARQLIAASKRGEDPFGKQDALKAIPKLSVFWDTYWAEHAVPKKSARSAQEDLRLWRIHLKPALGDLFIDQIDAKTVRKWHADKKGTPGAANRALALLSKMMSLAVANELRPTNPCKHIQRYPENRRDPDVDPELAVKLWALAQIEEQKGDAGAARVMMLIMLTGARRGEVLQARWRDFDLSSSMPLWRVPTEHIKGGERRGINITRNLSADTVALLQSWKGERGPDDLLFPSVKGEGGARYDIRDPWDRIRRAAGRPELRIHDLRHMFATLAIFNGHTLDEIGETIGHRDPTTTRRYAHILARTKSQVANSVSSIVIGNSK